VRSKSCNCEALADGLGLTTAAFAELNPDLGCTATGGSVTECPTNKGLRGQQVRGGCSLAGWRALPCLLAQPLQPGPAHPPPPVALICPLLPSPAHARSRPRRPSAPSPPPPRVPAFACVRMQVCSGNQAMLKATVKACSSSAVVTAPTAAQDLNKAGVSVCALASDQLLIDPEKLLALNPGLSCDSVLRNKNNVDGNGKPNGPDSVRVCTASEEVRTGALLAVALLGPAPRRSGG